jgi:hypothetical protein
MKINIEINLDNAAYQENYISEINDNIANMLMKVRWGDDTGIIFDSNGNKTGHWEITE